MGALRRFTLRRLMAVTMLLGLLVGGGIELARWPQRASSRRSIAADHAATCKFFGGHPEAIVYWTTRWRDQMPAGFPAGDFLKEFVGHHDRMRIKWERAAGRPWAIVDPDPPAPAPADYWDAHRPR